MATVELGGTVAINNPGYQQRFPIYDRVRRPEIHALDLGVGD
jgi:hypothetical protein